MSLGFHLAYERERAWDRARVYYDNAVQAVAMDLPNQEETVFKALGYVQAILDAMSDLEDVDPREEDAVADFQEDLTDLIRYLRAFVKAS